MPLGTTSCAVTDRKSGLCPALVRFLRLHGESRSVNVRHDVHEVDASTILERLDGRLCGARGDLAEIDGDHRVSWRASGARRNGEDRHACDSCQLECRLIAEEAVRDEVAAHPTTTIEARRSMAMREMV
jgi:hypothetical protein